MDPRFKRAIESLLREFLPQLLGLAKPKAPVTGGIGEAYLNLPAYDEPDECFRHENGLADIRSVDPDEDTGFLDRLYSIDRHQWENNVFLAPQFSDLFTSMYDRLPGKYTGEMRRVVQAMAGKPEPIPYDYKWSLTHCIFYTLGFPWVIEISANGVRAKRLMFCDPVDENGDPIVGDPIVAKLGYYPAQPNNNWWTDTDWVELIAASDSDLVDFYAENALFPACGWAANSDGTEIRNTSIGSAFDAGNGFTYFTFSEWAIEITADASHNPESATLSRIDTGTVHGDRVNHFKYPEESTFGGTWLKSFDWYGGRPSPTIPLSDCAFWVFWDGGRWVKGMYRAPKPDEGEIYDHRPPGFSCQRPAQPGGTYTLLAGSSVAEWPAQCVLNIGESVDANGSWTDQRWHGAVVGQGEMAIRLIAADYVNRYEEAYLGYAFQYASGAGVRNYSGCIIPNGDREAVYHFTRIYGEEIRSGTTYCGGAEPMYGGSGPFWHCLRGFGPCPDNLCDDGKAYNYPGVEHPGDGNIHYSNKASISGSVQSGTHDCDGDGIYHEYMCVSARAEPNVASENDGTHIIEDRQQCTLYASGGVSLTVDPDQPWLAFCDVGIDCGQYAHVIPDGINPGRIIASKILRPTSGNPDTRVELETWFYPTAQMSNAKEKAWIGDPGDLLGP